MKIAIPTNQGKICAHFGHCEVFTVFEVEEKPGRITRQFHLNPPAHEPGILPRWLQGEGVHLVIAGGMGRRAQDIFARYGIKTMVGVSPDQPAEEVVKAYLQGDLQDGENLCDH